MGEEGKDPITRKSASASLYIMRTRKLFPMHCKENPIYVFLFWELRSLSVGIGETEQQSSVVEITVSFLGIYKWEPDIYIGFSPSLHLQCAISSKFSFYLTERAIPVLWLELLNVTGRQQHNQKNTIDKKLWRHIWCDYLACPGIPGASASVVPAPRLQ